MPHEAALIALAILSLFVLFQLKLTRNEVLQLRKTQEKIKRDGTSTALPAPRAAELSEDEELVAVLTAAILAYESGQNGTGERRSEALNAAGFRIRRISRLR